MASTAPRPRIKPKALRPGDTIGIVAPASNIKRDLVELGCDALHRLGYKTVYEESIFEQDLYFAGSLDRRVRELEGMFLRDDVKAILCARGGYGANYLLSRLDLEKVKANPKIFMGYSDLTCLLTWFADAANLVTFHSPMLTKDFASADGVDLRSFDAVVSGAEWALEAASGLRPLMSGSAEGILYGGCLSILVASLGTPYEIETDGTILFLEDVGVKPYQVDRMLMQLKLSGKLAGVKGLVFGEMMDCIQHPNQPFSLEQVILRIVGDMGIPVAFGLRSGHVSHRNVTLPFGVRVTLNVGTTADLSSLEPAVSG
jgi:muramoyltetrapeptide carboxypeptidase